VQPMMMVSKFLNTTRDRGGEWVMRFGRGLGLAALISGLLWGAIILLIRVFF
jgi:hypothetical protein